MQKGTRKKSLQFRGNAFVKLNTRRHHLNIHMYYICKLSYNFTELIHGNWGGERRKYNVARCRERIRQTKLAYIYIHTYIHRRALPYITS